MTHPKISIITICYNSARTIEETIKSVIAQDYDNMEYIIKDGGSTDATLSIANKYKDKITKIISTKDKGISDAFNQGIELATGDLICFINSDDILLPGCLKKVALEYDGNADIYCGNVLLWDETTDYTCREVPSTDFPVTPYFRHVAHQGMFASKECYSKMGGYDINIRFPMDLDFLCRATRKGARFHYMNIDIAKFRNNGATGSNSIYQKKKDYIYMVRKNGGTMIQAFCFYYFLIATQLVKGLLSVFGKNFSQKLRYKRA